MLLDKLIYISIGIVIGFIIGIFIKQHSRAKLKRRILELEDEMLRNHARILEMEKEKAK